MVKQIGNIDSLLREKLQLLNLKFEHIQSNNIIKSFLSNENHYQLFINAVNFPSKDNNILLDSAFQRFFTEIRLIYYISQHLTFFARHYKMRIIKETKFSSPILDQPMKTTNSSLITFKELIDNSCEEIFECIVKTQLLDYLQNPVLYKAFQQLTERQREILDFYFIYGFKHIEIAKMLGISQQAVSKSYQSALRKIRDHC